MPSFENLLSELVGLVWGLPLVIVLVVTGLALSALLGGIQFRGFRHAIQVIRGKYEDPDDPGEITHFQALTTALSATVGLGNIAGVAMAIHLGGPGAVFWMILTGFVGMATKFSECSLAVMYRTVDSSGRVRGGPMHYIVKGLGAKWRPLAIFFSFACIFSTLGSGNMFQSNQVASILSQNFSIPTYVTGLLMAIATAAVIVGGIKRIGTVTSKLVPIMGVLYVLGALVVVISNASAIPSLFYQIIHDAFNGTAAVGGFSGIAFKTVLIQGVRRACFSNEAGLGSAPIAHAAVSTKEPIREGIVALLEPFIDTVVICTMTALVILISGSWTQGANGVELTAMAFDTVIPGFGRYFIPIAVLLFAYSTLLSWSYYGEQAFDFIFQGQKKLIYYYKILFCVMTFMGAIWKINPILDFSDLMLGLMVIPNLIAVWLLFPKLKVATKEYFSKYG